MGRERSFDRAAGIRNEGLADHGTEGGPDGLPIDCSATAGGAVARLHWLQETTTRKLQLREAKAALSAVIDDAQRGEPSIITRHGRPAAVLLSFADWERLSHVPSFGRLLMEAPLAPGDLPGRNDALMRDPEF